MPHSISFVFSICITSALSCSDSKSKKDLVRLQQHEKLDQILDKKLVHLQKTDPENYKKLVSYAQAQKTLSLKSNINPDKKHD